MIIDTEEDSSPLPFPMSYADKMFMEKLTRKGQQCFKCLNRKLFLCKQTSPPYI